MGILDFQDAMIGPVTYDLVSLIRDCYIDWPLEQVNIWAENFYLQNLKHLISSKAEFMRYFDLMGIQRHLKAIFIFSRKFHRDGVDSYLKDIPRTLKYIVDVSQYYPELREFRALMEEVGRLDNII
jgi:aminoglycoside/choline kinase family phosphotransferase